MAALFLKYDDKRFSLGYSQLYCPKPVDRAACTEDFLVFQHKDLDQYMKCVVPQKV